MKTINLTANFVQFHPPNDGKFVIEFGCGRFRLRLHMTRSLIAPLARVLHEVLKQEQACIDISKRAMQG